MVSKCSSSSTELQQCSGFEPQTGYMELAGAGQGPCPAHGKIKRCKVVGCSADLQLLGRTYCLRKHICPDHLKADAIRCEGMGDELWRFCQQCGKLELLHNFEGSKRSCRTSLHKRRLQASDKQPKCHKRQHQQALTGAAEAAGGSQDWSNTCCPSDEPGYCNNTAEAAAAALAAAWCEYQQQQVAWTQQQLPRSDSTMSSGTWPATAGVSVATADVHTAAVACDIWAAAAAAEAGNAYSTSMPGSPAAAAALPTPGSGRFQVIQSNTSMCNIDMDADEDALLDWMLEMEGELLAAEILATNNSPGTQQEQPWSSHAAAPALHQQQPCATAAPAMSYAQSKPLPTTPCCAAVAAAAAAAPECNWAPANVAAAQQLPSWCTAPAMPTIPGVAPLVGLGQSGSSFSTAAVPSAAGPSMLHVTGPHGGDRCNVINNKLQALSARFGQLQLLMDYLKQLRTEEAALRAQLVGALAPTQAATCSYACAGW